MSGHVIDESPDNSSVTIDTPAATARRVRESYDGGSVEVEPYDRTTQPYAHPTADGRIVLDVTERGMGRATLHLTRDEVVELAAHLHAVLAETTPPAVTP